MTDMLAMVLCNNGLTSGFAEVRRLIHGKGITVNGELAHSWNQEVHSGDIIRIGKRKSCVVN